MIDITIGKPKMMGVLKCGILNSLTMMNLKLFTMVILAIK